MKTLLPWRDIEPAIPVMRRLGVSTVARSPRGFLAAYRRGLDDYWIRRREGFIARHMAQVRRRGEPLWVDGQPTRRHLELIAWAYTPTPGRWRRWLGDR